MSISRDKILEMNLIYRKLLEGWVVKKEKKGDKIIFEENINKNDDCLKEFCKLDSPVITRKNDIERMVYIYKSIRNGWTVKCTNIKAKIFEFIKGDKIITSNECFKKMSRL